jgi:diguanylate cyclase (GGDEF)-like protein
MNLFHEDHMKIKKTEFAKILKHMGVEIIQGKYISKSSMSKVIADYQVPKLPDELKFAKTDREKQYLEIIKELMSVIKADPMTGLVHKEHFKSLPKTSGVYIMIDGDGLKKINDTHGHSAGHAAILAISDGIKAALRNKEASSITRLGGDEFMIHLENVSMPTGIAIAKRVLESIQKQKISQHYTGPAEMKEKLDAIPLSASIGVGYDEESADEALYKAKKNGRNRVEFTRHLKAA